MRRTPTVKRTDPRQSNTLLFALMIPLLKCGRSTNQSSTEFSVSKFTKTLAQPSPQRLNFLVRAETRRPRRGRSWGDDDEVELAFEAARLRLTSHRDSLQSGKARSCKECEPVPRQHTIRPRIRDALTVKSEPASTNHAGPESFENEGRLYRRGNTLKCFDLDFSI
jgi:hypothetical protein